MSLLYRVARDVETISACAGWGHFDVGSDEWQCPQCLDNDDVKAGFASGLCPQCRERWLQLLGKVEYSAAFERRLITIVGIAGVVLGLSVWACNIQFGWWKQGAALGWISEIVASHAPAIALCFLKSAIISILIDIILIITLSASILTLVLCFSIIIFSMVSNPRPKRCRRHMTTAMYPLAVGQIVVYILFISWGITVREHDFVLGPLVIGTGCLIGVRVMRNSAETVDLEARVKTKLLEEEKDAEREM